MSTHENLKMIPVLKEKSTMAEFTTKMRVIKLVAKRNKCAKYFELGKHISLPLLEEALQGAPILQTDTTVDKHSLAVHILTIAFQNDVKLSSYIMETETAAWPTEYRKQVEACNRKRRVVRCY